MSEETIAKVGSTYVKIYKDDKGVSSSIVSDDDVFDAAMIEGVSLDAKCDSEIAAIVRETIDGTRDELKQCIRSIALKTIGFDDRWGKWEIDHCNGRTSILTDLVKNEVAHIVQTEIKSYILEMQGKILDEFKGQIETEFKEQLRREVCYVKDKAIKETAAAMVQRAVKENAEELIPELMTSVRQQLLAPRSVQQTAVIQPKTRRGKKT